MYDEETGFYYLHSRYYDPELCRFISADVLLSTGQGVIGCNAFAYCGNNPVNRQDDEGGFWHIVAGAIAGAVIGAASSLISSAINGEDFSSGKVWAKAAVSLGAGAIGGALSAAGLPIGAEIIAGAVLGATENITTQIVDNPKQDINWKEVAVSAIVGGIGGAISGSGATYGNKYISGHVKRAWNHSFSDGLQASLNYYVKMTSNVSKKYVKKAIIGVLKGAVASNLSKTYINYRQDVNRFLFGDRLAT